MRKFFKQFFQVYCGSEISKFVEMEIKSLVPGTSILDIGCGSQPYRKFCSELKYYSQDFGKSSTGIGSLRIPFTYGELNYIGNCWDVKENDNTFDAIICTEVLEHVPYPEKTIEEISRLLKPGGKLILTAPLFSLRHMDPYWFQPGFSNNWYELFLDKNNLSIKKMDKIGDYSMFMRSELIRVLAYNKWSFPFLLPAVIFMRFFFYTNRPEFKDLITMGYHIVAMKRL